MSGLDALAAAARASRAVHPDRPLAMATLYRVEGSSYRQPGARLLVRADGDVLAGAVSGGCLEGDIAAHAAAVCASDAPRLLTYDLGDDLQAIWGFGAMCNGIAHVLLEPLRDGHWLDETQRWRDTRTPGTLLTVLGDGPLGGTHILAACDPALQAAAAPLVHASRETARPVMGTLSLDGVDVPCLVDPVLPPIALTLIGAGRGAESFAAIATALGWRVTLVDHRPFVLAGVQVPETVVRVEARPEHGLSGPAADARTAVALLTHQFELDQAWLAHLLPQPLGYLGVLGSRQRAAQLLDALRDTGLAITDRMQRILHAPIGLDLGGESPESIALASIAEIEAVMQGRPGGSLRDRQSPIHARTPTPQPRA